MEIMPVEESATQSSLPVPSVVIVGGGQIGSRHLQAMPRLGREASVYVVDPRPESLSTAKTRYGEVASDRSPVSLHLQESLDGLPEFIEVAIIATSADVRLSVLRELLKKSRVKYLILEKVLFQSSSELAEAARLLNTTSTATWVNCPRRLLPAYSELRNTLAGVRPLQVRVSGTNWGIGCNSIHFLDLIQFLSGQQEELSFTSSNLGDAFPAKRTGFIEFTGSLDGRFGSDIVFTLTSFPAGSSPVEAPVMVGLDSPGVRCVIVEEGARINGWQSTASQNWEWTPFSCDLLFQSQMTHHVVSSLLDTGKCELPAFEEAARIHAPFLAVLNRHLFGKTGSETKCPIT